MDIVLDVILITCITILVIVFLCALVSIFKINKAKSQNTNGIKFTECIDTDGNVKMCNTFQTLEIGSLKTGDIICVSYSDMRKYFASVFYDSIWTHVGLIYVDPITTEVLVLEAAVYGRPYTGTLMRIPILHWVRININANAVGIVRINKPIPDTSEIIKTYGKYEELDIGIQSLDFTWFRFLQKKSRESLPEYSIFKSPDKIDGNCAKEDAKTLRNTSYITYKRKFHKFIKALNLQESSDITEDFRDYVLTCHEIIISVLQESGVFAKEITPCSYTPNEIAECKVPTDNGYIYEPVEIVDITWLSSDATMFL